VHFAFDRTLNSGAYSTGQGAFQQVNAAGSQSSQTNGVLQAAASLPTGAGVIVAILDTGVAFGHPALQGHLLRGYNALTPGSVPRDVPDGYTNNAVGHGTMIAGLIARLAPDAQILPIRVLNGDGTGCVWTIVAGIHYAVTHGARVINLSFGGPVTSDALEDALDEAEKNDVVVVAAAGNGSAPILEYPAALSGVVAVASVESNDRKSPWSNFGENVALVAPGSNIRSTDWTGGYATWSGTSFAAPFVTAAAVLVRSADPALSTADTVSRLRGTAHSVDRYNPRPYRHKLGSGLVDLTAAVIAVLAADN
jgi:subtilisin family serine protease